MPDLPNPLQIAEPIRNFIAQNLLYAEHGFDYADDASFLHEGIVDSLGVMQLVEFVEKHFGVRVDQREVTPENFDSIEKLVRFIQGKLPG